MQYEKSLRCFARGRTGDWEAICIDLDLAVQGRSFDDVKQSLEEAIQAYVSAACEEAPEVAEKLLNRTAPLWLRFKWAGLVLWHWINRRDDRDHGSYAGFDLHCPA